MSIEQYIKDATTTESRIKSVWFNREQLRRLCLMHRITGDLLDQAKKNIFYGKPINEEDRDCLMDSLYVHLDFFFETLARGEEPINIDPRLFHGIVGKCTEAAELLKIVSEIIDGNELDVVNLGEELGDDRWYDAIILDATGLKDEDIRARNIAKLKARYPNKFEASRAINRNVDAEREVLADGIDDSDAGC